MYGYALGTMTFTGKSGKEYEFNVWKFDTDFNAVAAVYVVTKRYKKDDGNHYHTKIYVGETGDLSERFNDHHKASCFRQNSANAICTHRQDDEKKRLAIEKDLLDNYKFPCNG